MSSSLADPLMSSTKPYQPGPPELDNMSSFKDLPPDSLLDNPLAAASTSSSSTNDKYLNILKPIRYQQSVVRPTSNGAAKLATTLKKLAQRRSAAAVWTESLSWLPLGWTVEIRIRTSGATTGMVDKYYYEPVKHHQFRSKKEVLYFLEFGTKRKRQKKNSDAHKESLESYRDSNKQKKSDTKGKTTALNIDLNLPEISDVDMEILKSFGSSEQKNPGAKGKTSVLNFDLNLPVNPVLADNYEDWNIGYGSLATSNGGHATI